LVVGLFYWRHQQAGPKTIAILPFRPLAVAERDEVWELGMADTLITRLSNPRLAVRPLSSVLHFNRPDQDPITAGKALNVEMVLESSYQKVDDSHIRVNLRLLNVADGTAAWTDSAIEKSTDPFILQETIAMKVVSGLTLNLTDDESTRLTKRYTNNIEAYNYYTLARLKELTLTDEGLHQAISYFEKAIGADPNYALAYAHEADTYRAVSAAGFARYKDVLPHMERLTRQAIELDGSLPEAHLQLAWIELSNGNLASAESKFKQVIQLKPTEFEAHIGLAFALNRLKKSEEAIAEIRRAREVAPTTPMALVVASNVLLEQGHIDEVINQAQQALEIDPNFWVAHAWLGVANKKQKRYTEAISELKKAKQLVPTNLRPQQELALTFAEMGDRERTFELIDEMNRRFKNNPPTCLTLATIYNLLGEKNKALDSLEEALEEREPQLESLKSDRRWDNLRSEPRFINILKRVETDLRSSSP
jgi:tetratricopeptide (TPR) repeat protein